jgi:hypothetical protein
MTPKGNHDCNISDAEITPFPANALLDKTRTFTPGQKVSPARCYNQCVEDPVCTEEIAQDQNTGQPYDVNNHLDESEVGEDADGDRMV